MYLAPVQPPRQRLPQRVYAARRIVAGIAAVGAGVIDVDQARVLGQQARFVGEAEALFYRELAEPTGVRTLRSLYADFDPVTANSVVITEDVVAGTRTPQRRRPRPAGWRR